MCNVVDVVGVVGKIGIPAGEKKNMEPKINKLGIKYYDKLPETARIAVKEDLFDGFNRPCQGKYYLLESSDGFLFYLKKIDQHTSIKSLLNYIEAKQVYVSIKDKIK